MKYKDAIKLKQGDEVILKQQFSKDEGFELLGDPDPFLHVVMGKKSRWYVAFDAVSTLTGDQHSFLHTEVK